MALRCTVNPHELLFATVQERIGRRQKAFGALADDLLQPLVLGLTEQLSIYCESLPARLRLGGVRLRQGGERAYVLAELCDGRGPLRLRDATLRWQAVADQGTDNPWEFVHRQNARRWRFVDRYLSRLLLPLLTQVSECVIEYQLRCPGAVPTCGFMRILEDVAQTYLCVEIDDRSGEPKPGSAETVGRYRVN